MKLEPIILLLTVFMAHTVFAGEIYRWTDEQGVMHFSDTQRDGAEAVKLPDVQSYTAFQPTMSPPPEPDTKSEKKYNSVGIVKPQSEDTIRNGEGLVSVEAELLPGLYPEHQARFLLDGQVVKGLSRATSTVLENVDRGEHQLQIEIVDENGNSVAISEPVTFFIHRPVAQPQPLPLPLPARG